MADDQRSRWRKAQARRRAGLARARTEVQHGTPAGAAKHGRIRRGDQPVEPDWDAATCDACRDAEAQRRRGARTTNAPAR